MHTMQNMDIKQKYINIFPNTLPAILFLSQGGKEKYVEKHNFSDFWLISVI